MALNAKADPNYVPKRINGRFAPGWSGNPGGSLEATRRSFNKDFLLALATSPISRPLSSTTCPRT
jgi:hypothetical protein